jgi:hypothetical protein
VASGCAKKLDESVCLDLAAIRVLILKNKPGSETIFLEYPTSELHVRSSKKNLDSECSYTVKEKVGHWYNPHHTLYNPYLSAPQKNELRIRIGNGQV